MPKIICTRPNASLLISGVNFTPLEDGTGIISEEISDEAADLFLSIDGYKVADENYSAPAVAPKPARQASSKPKAAATRVSAPQVAADAPAPAPAPAPVPIFESKPEESPAAGADGDGKDF